ncbi:TetR family transcriptional regulator [Streptomyces sp. NPDC059477]|uniref:TetR/AcrR family transcriptional regulator n=1 Tax=Streptomyces sp. NPDC059477 TaxID=3346847 RepID=UPI0036BDAC27
MTSPDADRDLDADRDPGPAPRSGPAPAPSDPSATPAPPPRRRGRPSRTDTADGPATRDRILAAAREEFSERGYDKTSVRGIAKAAGVDPALVHHYFGTKEQVFEAAVEIVAAPALSAPDVVVQGPLDGAGERLTRFFFGVWENPATRKPLLAVVRSAVNNEAARTVFSRLIAGQLLRRIADEVALPEPELRAELAASQLVGIAMIRYVIKVEPLASVDVERIIERVAPVVQGHLTNPW